MQRLPLIASLVAMAFHTTTMPEPTASAPHSRPRPRSTVVVQHVGTAGKLTPLPTSVRWSAAATIQLDGPVVVTSGSTLRIEAGTRIEGRVGAYIIIQRNARIEATGTLFEPIVMTCTTTPAFPGCWGGVIVLGNARINTGTLTSPVSPRSAPSGCLETVDPVASPARYGGCNDADDSGILTYLRVEHAERGLHLAAIGRGTVVHDIQANRSRNEGALITGGTAGVHNLFLTANGTALRWTGGWRGDAQFVAVQQDIIRFAAGIIGQNGTSGTTTAADALPRSNPRLYNVTVLAQSDPANSSHATARALVLERGTGGTIRNLFFYAPHIALDIAGTSTCAQLNAGALTLRHIVTAGATSLGSGATSAGCSVNESALLANSGDDNTVLSSVSGLLKSENDLLLPDLRPITGAPLALAVAATPPTGGIFMPGAFVGAIPEAGLGNRIPWFSGWTSPAPTPAPIPTGSIAGVVRSPLRGILGGTAVTDVTTGTSTTADASGRYSLTLPAGTALLDVSAVPAGCPEPATRAGTVLPNGSTTLDLLVDCPPLPGTQRIAAGAGFACAVADQGTFCWGDNSFGQLGNGTTTASLLPSPVSTDFTSLAVGSSHACGLEPNGNVRCWGRGNSGQLGDGSMSDRPTPVTTSGGPYALVATGGAHTCAMTVDGRVFCWGANESGQLGIGSTSAATSPQQVTGAPTFATITAGRSHTCALDLTGAAWCWGANDNGQLGDGTTTDRVRPVAVTGGNFFQAIATGGSANHACGTNLAGAVRCWGSNQFGQLGSGTAMSSASPIAVITSEALKEVAVGDVHTCAIAERTSQSLCWGANNFGQIGDGTTTNRPTPAAANASARFSRTMGGEEFSCAVTFGAVTGEDNTIVVSRRSLLCWGRNTTGQFGRGTITSALTPTAAATGLTIR